MQAICDPGERVLSYSVTTPRAGFNPTFEPGSGLPYGRRLLARLRRNPVGDKPLFRVTLGQTPFSELTGWGPPQRVISWVGARAGAYSEEYYFGNPGYYQTYVFTASSAGFGAMARLDQLEPIDQTTWQFRWPYPSEPTGGPAFEALPGIAAIRRETVVTTYTVIGSGLFPDDYPSSYGPHGDEIRTIRVT